MARRVNKKFLIIVTVALCCALVGAVGLKYVMGHHGADYYAQLAVKQEAAGNLEEAAKDYGMAFYASHSQNTDYLLKQADLFYKLTATDSQQLNYAVGTWRKVLEVDPQNVTALTRMVDILSQEVQFGVRAETLSMLTDYATRLHSADPSNAQAAAWMKLAPVEAYIGGVATDPVKLERQLADLQKVYEADPTNVQAMNVTAQARLKLSQAAAQQNDPDEAEHQRQLALHTFDQAVEKQPNNPDVWLHASQIDAVVLRAARIRLGNAETMSLPTADVQKIVDEVKAISTECSQRLAHGEALLKPSADNYEDLAVLAVELHADINDEAGALKACNALLKNRPDSLQGRVLFARLIKQDPSKWQQAVAVLTAPTSPGSNPIGVRARLVKVEQLSVLSELTSLRCDLCATETDPTKRAALLQQVEDGYTTLNANYGETPLTLKLKGRLLQLQGKTVDSVQALEKAQSAYQAQGQVDLELDNALAMTYWHMGQTGQARKIFQDIIKANPAIVQPHLMLADLLLEDNNPKDAEPELQYLERVLPNNPTVQQLRITSDVEQGNLDQAKSLYAKLPEATTRDLAIKSQIAKKLDNLPEAARLGEKLHSMQPNDMATVAWLCQIYGEQHDRDKANKLIDQTIAAHPEQAKALNLMRQQVMANSSAQKQQIAEEAIENSRLSPAEKQLQLYEIARQQGNDDEALKDLDKAEQLDPNNVHVLQMRLANDLLQKKFDDAQKYVDRLVKLDSGPDAGLLYRQQLALAKGDYDRASDLANQVIAKLPEFASGYEALGASLQAQGRYQEAIGKYLDALDRQNNNLRAMQGLIACYYALNRPGDAYRYITQARRTNPDEPLFKEMEIEYSLKYGDGTLAITARQDALKADPNNANKEQDLALAYLRAAEYRLDQHDTTGAQPYIDKLRGLITDGMQRWPDNRAFFALSGELALATNDFAGGEAAMNRMTAQPQWLNDPATYFIVSDFYRRFHKFDKAEEALREALDKGGGAEYRLALAQLLEQRGQHDQALALLEPMVDTDAVRQERVRILIDAGRMAQAQPILQSLLASQPNSPELQREMLQLQAGQSNPDALMSMATAMLAKDPKNDTALFYRALARMRQSSPDFDGAMHDLQTVLQDDPTNVDSRYWLAEIYRQRNDWDSAISQLQQGLTAEPQNKLLRMKLIELDSTSSPPRWSDVEQLINTALADPQLQNDPTWQLAAGTMWKGRNNPGQAIAAYQAAVKMAPKDQGIFEQYIDTLLWAQQDQQVLDITDHLPRGENSPAWIHEFRAVAAAQLKHPDQAKTEILAAIAGPDAVNSHAALLALVESITNSGQAPPALQAIAGKIPTSGRWQVVAAYLEHNLNDDGRAADLMVQAATSGSDLTPSEKIEAARWASMLNMTRQPPDFEKAVQMSKQVLAADPDNTEQLNNLACLLVDSVKPPRPAEALQYSQHAYDLMRKSGTIQPLVQDTQGWVLVNNGQIQDGTMLLRQVVDNNPFLDAYYHLAEAYLRSNQPAAAQTQLKLASQTLEDLQKNKQPYDSTLPARIRAAQEQAKEMAKMQASAPR